MREPLLDEVRAVVNGQGTRDEKLAAICRLLATEVDHYDWVGFYLVENPEEEELILGPFEGEPTEHTRIAFGQGICGQAAATQETFVIQDVSRESNYLACSPDVKSEIVIPIFRGETIVGELDIDSHALAPFTPEDREFLEEVSTMVAEIV